MTYQTAVAVVGIGCRFPGGADSPAAYWDLLREARDASGPAPAQRWEHYADRGPSHAAALRRAVAYGSFLDAVEDFDADFFGLSPREAELMDPQQRLMLETSWEALEHAGVPPTALAGTDTGVYVGVCTGDYGHRLLEDLPDIEAWTGIGAATCAVANRVSYAFDLRGPSLAVDTACSASLVAVHLACQSLRAGESELALAGGVNLILSPGETLTLGAAGTLAPDGRSKSFDVAADGYGRGEGCAVVALKLLPDAIRDGDRVLATITGSAVRQDGHTNGIMAPCGEAQQHVMLQACLAGRYRPGHRGLHRSPRHRNCGRRPAGGGRAGRRLRTPAAGPPLPDWLGQVQHRPPGGRRRHRRAGEGGTRRGARRDPAEPANRAEPGRRLGRCRAARGH